MGHQYDPVNQHLWPLIETARSSGAKVVVIDPYRSHTAEQADLHIQLRPGTDVVLALSMIKTILDEGLQDQEYIDAYTSGFELLKNYVQDFDPDKVSETVGLPSDTIRTLARDYVQEILR